jgi:Polyketide cyclase / dehydrase and lipid transport
MAPIVESIEISRRPEDVFAYLDDLGRHHEWDDQIVSTRVETEGPTRVGSRATDTRKVPMGKQDSTYETTEHDPPRRAAFRGVNGPVRPVGSVTVEPIDDGARSRMTLELDLQGHGLFGKLLAPLASRDARKRVPGQQEKLKERLESMSS